MNMQRFEACARTHGAQRRRWPEPDHALFDALADTPDGARVLAQAEQVDALLDTWDAAEPSPQLQQRIAARLPPRGAAAPPARRPRLWLPLGGLALSLVMAFALGFHRAAADNTGLEALGRFLIDPSGGQGGVL
jgi:hypothetical protein